MVGILRSPVNLFRLFRQNANCERHLPIAKQGYSNLCSLPDDAGEFSSGPRKRPFCDPGRHEAETFPLKLTEVMEATHFDVSFVLEAQQV